MTKKGNLSNEEYFSLVASACGEDADFLRNELLIDKLGWKSVVESLIASHKETMKRPNQQRPLFMRPRKKGSLRWRKLR